MKALGEGWPKVSWQDIEIVRGEGRPELRLTGRAAALAGEASMSRTTDATGFSYRIRLALVAYWESWTRSHWR